MDSDAAAISASKLRAHVAPMVLFLLLLVASSILKQIGAGFWMRSPEYWIYPLQTVACAALLIRYWRNYEFAAPSRLLLTAAVAMVVFAIWISPQVIFGAPARTLGFNPETFRTSLAAYWLTVLLRFARLVIVVPLVEEIFWRGFLLRYLIDDRFSRVPFGTFSWLSFAVVSLAFMFTHATADWPAALICGALYNCVAYLTKSLASCVVAHAATNLLLGIWIMETRQWGFW